MNGPQFGPQRSIEIILHKINGPQFHLKEIYQKKITAPL